MGIKGDGNAQELAKFLRQGLQQLSSVGIPANKELIMVGEDENGHKRTFRLFKELTCNRPLNEIRVNRRKPGAFRAIFFEYEYEGEQLLLFTKAVIKKGDPNPPEFQTAIRESERLYDKFLQNPDKYIREDE
ncbi:hypothetical protein AB1K89_14455 [Sporosarcina sp. 179-K 8C2 HS]|uniref:hypothetical protein n=1 Tax=Sporosarcina sp. 179-K 8C2 HS TaxID=3142387 RepID=UPI00399F5CBA